MKTIASALLALCLSTLTASAQFQNTSSANRPTPPAPTSPIPPALLNSKTVFISNAGGPSGLFPHPFSGAPDRGYSQLYAAVKGWGRYALVDDPTNADLIFQIDLTAPVGAAKGSKQYGASDPLPEFHLIVYQRSTHVILWALSQSIEGAFVQKTHDENFDAALATLTSDLKALVAAPTPTP